MMISFTFKVLKIFLSADLVSKNRLLPASLLKCFVSLQVKTRVAGRIHTLTVRDVKLSEAGEVKLTAKDFQTQAHLIIRGQTLKHTEDSKHIISCFWLKPELLFYLCVQSHRWSSQSL